MEVASVETDGLDVVEECGVEWTSTPVDVCESAVSSIRSVDTVSHMRRAKEVTASLSSLVAVAVLGEGWRKK